MIIIEGSKGKSRALENLLKSKKSSKSLLVDTVGVKALYELCTNVVTYSDTEDMWVNFVDDEKFVNFIDFVQNNDYKLLVFETNDLTINIEGYNYIEEQVNIEMIVTIQNPNIKDVEVYKL